MLAFITYEKKRGYKLNILDFKNKVYKRIILQYIKEVRKEKPTFKDYLDSSWLGVPILISILSFLGAKSNNFWLEIFSMSYFSWLTFFYNILV